MYDIPLKSEKPRQNRCQGFSIFIIFPVYAYAFTTLAACGPRLPSTMSKETC